MYTQASAGKRVYKYVVTIGVSLLLAYWAAIGILKLAPNTSLQLNTHYDVFPGNVDDVWGVVIYFVILLVLIGANVYAGRIGMLCYPSNT